MLQTYLDSLLLCSNYVVCYERFQNTDPGLPTNGSKLMKCGATIGWFFKKPLYVGIKHFGFNVCCFVCFCQ
jgi:hypothetical protein